MKHGLPDKTSLLATIKGLCSTGIRRPLTMELTKAWLKQFTSDEEQFLGLLIIRHLIYRTSDQIDSSLKQALKAAAHHFVPPNFRSGNVNWRQVLNGQVGQLKFSYGPPKQNSSRPGKSGELISRQLNSCDPSVTFNLKYCQDIEKLEDNQRYLIVDDGTFTGDQLTEYLKNECKHLADSSRCAIIVALAHSDAITTLDKVFPNIPLFYGERLTKSECFEMVCKNWVEDEIWEYKKEPFELYLEICTRAKFLDKYPLGYGNLGCLVAYEHGIPDNTLQLLWGKSKNWNPLIRGRK